MCSNATEVHLLVIFGYQRHPNNHSKKQLPLLQQSSLLFDCWLFPSCYLHHFFLLPKQEMPPQCPPCADISMTILHWPLQKKTAKQGYHQGHKGSWLFLFFGCQYHDCSKKHKKTRPPPRTQQPAWYGIYYVLCHI